MQGDFCASAFLVLVNFLKKGSVKFDTVRFLKSMSEDVRAKFNIACGMQVKGSNFILWVFLELYNFILSNVTQFTYIHLSRTRC